MRVGVLSAEDDRRESGGRADRLARLQLVRSGVVAATTLAHERALPVIPGLEPLVPSGHLQRGSTLATHGPGATSFALAMSAGAVQSGSFLAIVAPFSFGLGACLDFDIPLRRVVQFVIPDQSGGGASWAQLVASIIEGFDLVLLADRRRVSASHARQLVARTRERGSVILRAGGPSWPDAPDVRYDLAEPRWHGLGPGHGHLRSRSLSIKVAGRRWHGTNQAQQLLLPGEHGVEVVEHTDHPDHPATVTPLRPGARALVDTRRHTSQRFAGADIDEMLDAIDHDGDGSSNDRPGEQPGDGAGPPPRAFGTVA